MSCLELDNKSNDLIMYNKTTLKCKIVEASGQVNNLGTQYGQEFALLL